MSGSAVLLLTHTADHFTIDRVAAAIERRGRRAFRFDTDQFPARVRLAARTGAAARRFTLRDGARELDASEVSAVWARRIWPAALDPALDPKFREACARESRTALEGFLDGCSGAHWINTPAADRRAGDKLLQLRLAGEHGLVVPRTLLTNDADEARAFFAEAGGEVVAKMLTPLTTSMEADGPFVYTSAVSEADLREAESLRHSPMLFQERVPKAVELRVVAVRGQLFVGAIDASSSEGGQVDWRRAEPGASAWRRGELPQPVSLALLSLLAALELEYAAIDFIRTPGGGHVFLEVNPGGEWGMLERDLDHPISEALARALSGE